jgi:pyruvate dehydrogenase E2 component (dihydrolipoamide acetyltransferase)
VADLKQVEVPDIGDFTDVAVVEVHVRPGDEVAENDPLVTLETDKATMDVPAPFGGVIAEVLLAVGDVASEGTPVVKLSASAEAAAVVEASAPSAVRSAVAAEASARPNPQEQPPPPKAPESAAANGGDPVYASPSVRRLARELGVPLGEVPGSGRKGRIVPEDVHAYADGGGRAAAGTGAAGNGAGGGADLGLLPWPKVDFAKYGEVERVELSKIRRISAANLSRNWVRIPHVTHNDEADVTDLEAFRKQLNGEQSDVKVTMVALLLKAVVASLKAFPDVNASLEGDGIEALIRKKYYHLGFAADTPNGLVVPVVKDVDRKGLLEVAAELTELSGKARAGKLMPAEMAGATFTISSLGGIGGTSFTPIVNAPEVAILGVVRSATKPVWDGKQFVPRLMLPLFLSYDHRVIDGAAAARFTAHLAGVLNDLRRVLL